MEKKERYLLFCLEVTLLTIIYHKIIKFEPLYKILFNSEDKTNEVINFLQYCTLNKSLLKFIQPPFREKIIEQGKSLFFNNKS